jgi:hypothetical protein
MYLNSKTKDCIIYYSYDNNYIEYNKPIDYIDKIKDIVKSGYITRQ